MNKIVKVNKPVPSIWRNSRKKPCNCNNGNTVNENRQLQKSSSAETTSYGIQGPRGMQGPKGDQGPQGEQGLSIAKSMSFGIDNIQTIKNDEIIPVSTTFISNGASIKLNEDNSFTFKEGGVYMFVVKGCYNILDKDETIYTPNIQLEIYSETNKYVVSDVEVDDTCVNNFMDIQVLNVSNDETFFIKNITGVQHTNKKALVDIKFHGSERPFEISLIKLS